MHVAPHSSTKLQPLTARPTDTARAHSLQRMPSPKTGFRQPSDTIRRANHHTQSMAKDQSISLDKQPVLVKAKTYARTLNEEHKLRQDLGELRQQVTQSGAELKQTKVTEQPELHAALDSKKTNLQQLIHFKKQQIEFMDELSDRIRKHAHLAVPYEQVLQRTDAEARQSIQRLRHHRAGSYKTVEAFNPNQHPVERARAFLSANTQQNELKAARQQFAVLQHLIKTAKRDSHLIG